MPYPQSFEEVIVNAPKVYSRISSKRKGNNGPVVETSKCISNLAQTSVESQETLANDGCGQLVVDVDVNSIIQSKTAGEQQPTTSTKQLLIKNAIFKCSKCPMKFSSRIMRLMHEKLHSKPVRDVSKKESKLLQRRNFKIRKIPTPAVYTSSESLLCKGCNTYFQSSIVKNKHQCSAEGQNNLRECEQCFQPFIGPSPMGICFACWKVNKYSKLAMMDNCLEIESSDSSSTKSEDECEDNGTPESTDSCKDPESVEPPAPRPIEEHRSPTRSPLVTEKPSSPRMRFACAYCSALFYFPHLLAQHSYRQHKKFFFCDLCSLNLKSDLQLEVHNLECRRVKLTLQERLSKTFIFDFDSLTCSLCNIEFVTESYLIDHAFAHHGNLTGGMCCGNHYSLDKLIYHKQVMHAAVSEVHSGMAIGAAEKCDILTVALLNLPGNDFCCGMCSFSAFSESALRHHQTEVHEGKT